MGGVWYVILGLVLLGLNFCLVYFIRTERSFIVFPGLIYTVLFLGFGAYLLYQVNSLAPEQTSVKKRPRKQKTMVSPRAHADEHAEQYALAQVEFQKAEKESKIRGMIESVCFLINLLGIQAILSGISAFAGAKVIPVEKRYHYSFLGLYAGLMLIGILAEFQIHIHYL
jgi:hypothetical protein